MQYVPGVFEHLAKARPGEHPHAVGSIQARLRAVRAPQAKINQLLAPRDQHAARRLGGDERLEMDQVHQPRLDQLRLRHGRRHAQDWLVGKEDRALGHGMHVAAEAPSLEVLREFRRKKPAARDPLELLWPEARLLQKIEGLLEAGRHHEVAVLRQLADEELEDRGRFHALAIVRMQHGELVEIGQERRTQRVHHASSS